MKIAVFSPLNPLKTGVSDFTEEVVQKLRDYISIDLFVDNFKPSNVKIAKEFPVYQMSKIDNAKIRNQYDFLLYHIGNNYKYHERIVEYSLKYPGIVEVHDFALHYFLAETTYARGDCQKYVEVMEYCHGVHGQKLAKEFLEGKIKAPWETNSLGLPVNKHIMDNARAIIVHSDYAKQMLKGMGVSAPIETIYLHTNELSDNFVEHRKKCRKILGIDSDTIILGSFGFATSAKRIYETLQALAMLKKKMSNFHYYIVGEVQNMDLKNLLKETQLSEHVSVTGFVDLDAFSTYMGACDICFCLRYPTQGESSASLHRMLGMGKVIFVTTIGAFEEYPDDIVVKIKADKNEVNSIYENLLLLLDDKDEFEKKQYSAVMYAEEFCNLHKNCKKYNDFLISINKNAYSENDCLEKLVDKIFNLKYI